MNPIPALESLAAHVLEASIQASLLALCVLLTQWTLRRWLSPGWRHALWLMVVIRLLCPALPQSPSSAFNLFHKAEPASSEPVAFPSPQIDLAPAHETRVAPTPNTAISITPVTPPKLVTPTNWRRILTISWAVGGGALLLLTAIAYLRVRRSLATATAVTDPDVLGLLEETKRLFGITTPIRVLITPHTRGPALFGLIHKRLLLPVGLIDQFHTAELRHILAHECAHLKRRDVAVNWIVSVLQAIHWFNPVLWFAFARMRTDRESACDALAIRLSLGEDGARDYGRTIIRLLERAARPGFVPGLVGVNESRSDMKRRVQQIAAFRFPSRWSLLALIPATVIALTMLTDAQSPPRPPELRAGQRWFELGEYDKAIAALETVVSNDPDNTVARRYLQHARNGKNLRAATAEDSESQGLAFRIPAGDRFINAAPPFLTHATRGAERIRGKLDTIVVSEAKIPKTSLYRAATELIRIGKRFDPDGNGVNFLVPVFPANNSTNLLDAMGNPLGTPNLGKTRVHLQSVSDVSLKSLLDRIVASADAPIRYVVEEYAIVFMPDNTNGRPAVFNRVLKVDPTQFLQGLTNVVPATQSTVSMGGYLRAYLRAAGVGGLETTNGPPTTRVFYNDINRIMMITGTLQDLDVAKQAIELLSPPRSQPVRLDVLAALITHEGAKKLGTERMAQAARSTGGSRPPMLPLLQKPATPTPAQTPPLRGILTTAQARAIKETLVRADKMTSTRHITTTANRHTSFDLKLDDGSVVVLGLLPELAVDGAINSLTVTVDWKPRDSETPSKQHIVHKFARRTTGLNPDDILMLSIPRCDDANERSLVFLFEPVE